MGMIDVQACPVCQDHVRETDVFVCEQTGVGQATSEVEPAGVPQRALLFEVPPGSPRPGRRRGIGVDDLRGRQHRVGVGLPGYRDAELGLGAHHPAHTHAVTLRAD